MLHGQTDKKLKRSSSLTINNHVTNKTCSNIWAHTHMRVSVGADACYHVATVNTFRGAMRQRQNCRANKHSRSQSSRTHGTTEINKIQLSVDDSSAFGLIVNSSHTPVCDSQSVNKIVNYECAAPSAFKFKLSRLLSIPINSPASAHFLK